MSSKALTLTAAIASACAVALGQTTSQNVVGYINIDLVANQYALVANQLDNGKGNKVGDLLKGVPNNSVVVKFNNSKGSFEANNTIIDGEFDAPDQTLAPGEGAFIRSPAAAKVTFVGEVKQGASSVPLRANGYSLISSIVPQDIDLTKADTYGMKPNEGDIVIQFVGGKYLASNTYVGGFDPETIKVGSAFWYFNNSKSQGSWDRTFTVQ